jgi:hypothetical protein
MRKDDDAGNIARGDGITEGLICVYQTLENCSSWTTTVFPLSKTPREHKK